MSAATFAWFARRLLASIATELFAPIPAEAINLLTITIALRNKFRLRNTWPHFILMLFEQSLCLNTYVKHESGQEKKILT